MDFALPRQGEPRSFESRDKPRSSFGSRKPKGSVRRAAIQIAAVRTAREASSRAAFRTRHARPQFVVRRSQIETNVAPG
jgi:hypothetical protein